MTLVQSEFRQRVPGRPTPTGEACLAARLEETGKTKDSARCGRPRRSVASIKEFSPKRGYLFSNWGPKIHVGDLRI